MADEIERILDQCLDEARGGGDPEAILRQHAEVADEVRPLLALAGEMAALPAPQPTANGLAKLFARLAVDAGRSGARAARTLPTRTGSDPQSASRPSTWTSSDPKARSAGSVAPATPGLNAARASSAAASHCRPSPCTRSIPSQRPEHRAPPSPASLPTRSSRTSSPSTPRSSGREHHA